MLRKYPEYVLFFFTFLVRYLIIFVFLKPAEYLQFMPKQFDIRAVDFALGQLLFNPEQWSYYYIPLGMFYKVLQVTGLLADRIIAVTIMQIILGALSIVVFYKIAKLFVTAKTAFILSIIGALYYPLIYFNALNISETLYLLLILESLYILFTQKTLKPKMAIFLGVLLGLAYIIKPMLLFFFPLLLIWIYFTKQSVGAKLKTSLCVIVPVVLITFLAGVINMGVSRHNQLIMSSSGAANFAMTQCHIKKLEYHAIGGETAWFSPPLYWNTDYPEVLTTQPFRNSQFYLNMGLDCIKKDPMKLASNITNLPNIFFGPFYPDFTKAMWHKAAIQTATIVNVIFFILFVLFIFVERNKLKRRRVIIVYLLIAGVFISIYLANPGESRYGHTYFLLFLLFGYQTLILVLKRFSLLKK